MPAPASSVFRGLWVPVVTPFADDGSLDVDSLFRLAVRLLDDGADGLVPLGTTGEPATLDAAERRTVVEICDRACRERGGGLIVGAGTNSTQGTIDEVRLLTDDTTALAALVVAPYYTRPSEAAVVEHFGLVADASPVPIVMYNVPYRTGIDVGSGALLSASAHPNVVGLKQAVGAVDVETLELLAHGADDFAILAGDDAFIAPTILLGGHGAIAAAAHMCTPRFVEMVAAAQQGDVARAVRIAERLLPVVRRGFAEPNPSVWKAVLAAKGEIASAAVRRPLTTASTEAADRLLAAVEMVSR